MYLTPTVSVSNAILLRYTCTVGQPTNEASILDVNANLALAIVDYVKFRLAQDEEKSNERKIKYWYGEFKRRIWESQGNKVAGIRKAIPSGAGVLK